MGKNITITGLPETVKVETIQGSAWAYLCVEDIKHDEKGMKELSEIILKLSELGFGYHYTTYDMGYYGAVENITLEFYNPKFKK